MEKSVLIIEDSRSFALLVASTLQQRYQYETTIAETYAAAESVLKAQSNDYFAAIVDLNLPDAPSGEAVELSAAYKIPSIVFTGQLSESLREDVLNKGVSDYVLKTGQYNIDYVVDAIHRLDCNREIKILVVDDSITARRQMKRLLLTQCYQVVEAESGLAALAVLEEHPDISITITDCHMDGMDGFELTKAIRQCRSKETMAIIGVSAQGGSSISAQFIKSGADDFIVKPFIQEEFTCRVNKNAETLEHFAHLKALSNQKNFLMGMAAHDIRNPLGIIDRIVKRAISGNPSPERMSEYLDLIERNCQGLLELLTDILEISRIEGKEITMDKEMSSIEQLLIDRIDMFKHRSSEKSIDIVSHINKHDALPVDQKRVVQVVDNLISNALKFSPQGSTVTVSTEAKKEGIIVSICDHGPGVGEEEEPFLFDAFSQLSARPTGGESSTGLGLSICKSIIESHGGSIGYERLEDSGSRFYFSLPHR